MPGNSRDLENPLDSGNFPELDHFDIFYDFQHFGSKVPNPNKARALTRPIVSYFKNRSKQCGTNSTISSPSIITCNSYVVCLAFSCLVTMQ